MTKTLSLWMTIIIGLNIAFAPILAYIDSLHREAVETVLTEGSKKAAIEGHFTTVIIDDMTSELVNNYNFTQADIQINATQTLTSRGNYIEASITVPRGIIFIFDIFNQGPTTITKSTKVLSEYLN